MMARRHFMLPLVALALSSLAGGPAAQQRERYSLEGDEIEIYDVAGELRVEPGSGSAVVVEVVRGGRDAGALKVSTGKRGRVATLAVAFPGRRIVYDRIRGSWSTQQNVTESGEWGKGWQGRSIRVSGTGSGTHAYADLRIQVPAGRKVSIHHMAGAVLAEGVRGDLCFDQSLGRLEVKSHHGDLALDTGSGEVVVADLEGDLSLDSGSGEVSIAHVRGERLSIDSGSGEVRVENARVEDLDADSGSGAVQLRDVGARRIQVDSGSGEVEIELAGDVDDVVVDSGSGEVTLRVPPSFGVEYSIETSGGDIRLDVEHEVVRVDRDSMRGTIGDGRGTLRIDSGSGGVRIVPARGARSDASSGRIGLMGQFYTDLLS